MAQKDFQMALQKLVTDPAYGKAIEANSDQLISDFNLSQSELGVLGSVWQAAHGSDAEVEGHFILALCCYIKG